LFVVIGATVALSPTPGMLGYGLSKTGVHHFIQTVGEICGKSVTTKSRRKKARKLRKDNEYLDTLSIVGILPTTVDTPNNRDAMPEADFSLWTQPQDIAAEIGTWIQISAMRPHSGSLVKVFPNKTGGGASFNLVR
jgi:dihydropteridine reductase